MNRRDFLKSLGKAATVSPLVAKTIIDGERNGIEQEDAPEDNPGNGSSSDTAAPIEPTFTGKLDDLSRYTYYPFAGDVTGFRRFGPEVSGEIRGTLPDGRVFRLRKEYTS